MEKPATNTLKSKIEPEIFADELFGVIRRLGYKRFMALVKLIEENHSVELIAKDFNRTRQSINLYRNNFFQKKYELKPISKKIIKLFEDESFVQNIYWIKQNKPNYTNQSYEWQKILNESNF